MSDRSEKNYTPQEAAMAILEKCKELYKNSTLAKANTSHEIEPGGEPSNDDAECPEQLQSGEVTKEGSFGSDKKKKKPGEGDSEDDVSPEEAGAMEDIAEEEVNEHNEHLHEGQEHESAEGHEDDYGEDEEPEEDEEDKDDEKKDKKDKEVKKALFEDKAIKLESKEYKPTKQDVFWDIKYCLECMKKMRELRWVVEDEAPEAKDIFEKEYKKEKAKLDKLIKKYKSLKKGESEGEEKETLTKAEEFCYGLQKKEMSVKEAVDKILHDKWEVHDVLPKVPKDKKDDVLKQLRKLKQKDSKKVEKSTHMAKKRGVPEGVKPSKMESCVKQVKGKDVKNPYAVCSASLQGETKKSMKKKGQPLKEFMKKRMHKKASKKY